MKQIACKGDEYHIWDDTYDDPTKLIPPPPNPPDPEDPKKYATPPFYEPLIKVTEEDAPDTGEEFVFCNEMPVAVVGYIFSTCTKDTIRRQWVLDEKGHLKENKDKKAKSKYMFSDFTKESITAGIMAKDGEDYVFIDGVPISCMNGGVTGGVSKTVLIDGELVTIVEPTDVDGEFTKCYGHVYFDSV